MISRTAVLDYLIAAKTLHVHQCISIDDASMITYIIESPFDIIFETIIECGPLKGLYSRRYIGAVKDALNLAIAVVW